MSDPTNGSFVNPTPPFTATVLKRMAEAVSGERSGDLVFVVVDTALTNAPLFAELVRVVDGDESRARGVAEARANQLGPTFIVGGPYQTTRDAGTSDQLLKSVMFIAFKQPDTKIGPTLDAAALTDDIESVTVSIALKPGRQPLGQLSRQFNGPLEAVFLSLSGVDKFWLPYLTSHYNPQVAANERSTIVQTISTSLANAGY